MKKRGQVAMEFLMTYGWAIIIILLAIAALWLLGVFNFDTPSKCTATAPFACNDVVIGQDFMVMKIGSGNINSGQVSSLKVNGKDCTDVRGVLIPNQETEILCNGLSLKEDEDVTADFEVSYKNTGSGFTQVTSGSVSGSSKKNPTIAENPSLLNGDFELGDFNWYAPGTDARYTQSVQIIQSDAHSRKNAYSGSITYPSNWPVNQCCGLSIRSTELIPVDTAKTYVLEGWFKRISGSSGYYFGLTPYDQNKVNIPCGNQGCCSELYVAARDKRSPIGEWSFARGEIGGEGLGCNLFRPGTKYVRVIFLLNYQPSTVPDSSTTLADGIKFYEKT